MVKRLLQFRLFWSTLVIGLFLNFGFQFTSGPSDGSWAAKAKKTVAENGLMRNGLESIPVETLHEIVSASGVELDDSFETLVIYVTDTQSCPMIYNDVKDYYDLTSVYNVFSITVLADQGMSNEELSEVAFLKDWIMPVVLKPNNVDISQIGHSITPNKVLPELHIVDLKTGKVLKSLMLSPNTTPVKLKHELLSNSI